MKNLAKSLAAGAAGAVLVGVLMAQPAPRMTVRSDGLEFPDGTVQTTAARTDPRPAFYLTRHDVGGSGALTACASGYHMAHLYEILDISNLRYESEHPDAYTTADSGEGPPVGLSGA